MKLYGVENYFNSDDFKNKSKITIQKLYGNISNVFQNEEIKNKSKTTNLKKYGVEYPSQNIEIHIKQQKSGFKLKKHKLGLNYRGKNEKIFLDYCFDNDIEIESGPRIKYLLENKGHYYFSDFYFKKLNLIIEIKSDYYYEKKINKNLAKRKYSIKNGFDFIFIINNDFDDFQKLLLQINN